MGEAHPLPLATASQYKAARGSGVVPAERAASAVTPGRLRWDGLLVMLALLVLVQVWRVHDLGPALSLPGVPTLCMLATLLWFWLDRDPRRRLSGLDQPVVRVALAILVLAALSIPGSMDVRHSAEFVLKGYQGTIVLMVLIAASVRGLADLRRLIWVQVAGATLLAAVVVAGAQITSDRRLRSAGYYDPNDLAMLIVSTLPLVLYLWRRPAGPSSRVLLAGATALLMVTLGQTGSRGGFLAFLAVVGYLLVGFRGISKAQRAVTVTLLGILLVVVASDRYFARIETILHPSKDYNWSGRSETGRMEIWKRGVGYMARYPLLGVGAAAFPIAEGRLAPEAREQQQYGRGFKWSAAHNSFIQVGAELGAGGLILFVVLLVSAFRTLSQVRRPVGEFSVLAQVLTASLVGFVVAACFLSQAYSAYLYALLGMSVGLARVASPARGPAPQTGRLPGSTIPDVEGALRLDTGADGQHGGVPARTTFRTISP